MKIHALTFSNIIFHLFEKMHKKEGELNLKFRVVFPGRFLCFWGLLHALSAFCFPFSGPSIF